VRQLTDLQTRPVGRGYAGDAQRDLRLVSETPGTPETSYLCDTEAAWPGGANVGFAERPMEVRDSGRRTATYKLALPIALLDLCAQPATPTGGHPGCSIPGTSRSRRRPCTGRK
jgi:hypothetical protein